VVPVCSPESSLTNKHYVAYAGMSRIAPSPFFDAKWTQYRNAPECTQLFAKLAPPHATVHALVSTADFSAEAMKLSLRAGPDLEQLLAQVTPAKVANVMQCVLSPKFCLLYAETIYACFQVDCKSGLNADADLPLEQYTAGCTMLVRTPIQITATMLVHIHHKHIQVVPTRLVRIHQKQTIQLFKP